LLGYLASTRNSEIGGMFFSPRDAQRDVLSAKGASLARSMPTPFIGKDQKYLCLMEEGESGRML